MAAQPAFSGTAFNNNNNNNHYFPASLSEMSNRGALVETPLSGVDRTFPRGPATLDMSAPQPYPNYNVYDPNREDVDYPAQISGLVGSEDSLDDPEASSSAGRTGSDNEADSVNKSDKAFQHLVYDPTTVKHRRRTTASQLEVLDAHFTESPKPDMDTRRFLSKQLGMTVREVQVWFQNRRAKQKKIDSRAQSTGEQSATISPTFLTAPQQVTSASSQASSNTSFSGYSMQSVPPLVHSNYSNMYHPSSYGASFSDAQQPHQPQQQHGSNVPYYSPAVVQAPTQGVPMQYQQQLSYFPDVRPNYTLASNGSLSIDESAISPRSYFANVQPFSSNSSGQDRWSPSQAHFMTQQDSRHVSDSVSPASSRGSSHDESSFVGRRKSTVPHALSNLSGLSIMPPSTEYRASSTESGYIPGAPINGSAVLALAGMPAVPPYTNEAAPNLSQYGQVFPPAYATSSIPAQPILSPTAPGYTSTYQSGAPVPLGTAVSENLPHYAPMQVYGNNGLAQPISLQRTPLLQQVPPFGVKQAFVPLSGTEAVLQMSATLAARRQSVNNLPERTQPFDNYSLQPQQQSRHEMISSIPKGFKLLDESRLPIRRASTSVLGNITSSQTHHQQIDPSDPLAASRQAALDSAAQAVLPLATSPRTKTIEQHHHAKGPASPARINTKSAREGGASSLLSMGSTTSVAAPFEDMAILGGLRRGSIKTKNTSSTYSPYPQIHLRNASSTSEFMDSQAQA